MLFGKIIWMQKSTMNNPFKALFYKDSMPFLNRYLAPGAPILLRNIIDHYFSVILSSQTPQTFKERAWLSISSVRYLNQDKVAKH